MSAKLVVEPVMISFAEEMEIDLAHDRPIAVGIAQGTLGAIEAGYLYQIGKILRPVRHSRLVKAFDMEPIGRINLALGSLAERISPPSLPDEKPG